MLFKGVVRFFVFVLATNTLPKISKALPPRESSYETPLYPWEGLPPIYGLLPGDFSIQGFADDPGADDDPESIRWIFWLKSGASSVELDNVCEAGAAHHRQRCIKYRHTILGASTQMTVSQLKSFLDEHGEMVQSVYRDGKVEGLSLPNGLQDGESLPWHLDRIDQDNRDLDTNFVYPTLGSGVAMYIVDTGIQTTHNEFKHIDGAAGTRASFAFSVFNDADDGSDCNGHGTHVAGIAAGLTYGAAKNATLFDVRALDCSKSSVLSDTLSGLEWIAQNHVKPAVVVLSLGGGANSLLDASVQALYDLDVTVVTAAGNSAEGDFLYESSNFGSCVDVLAPGDMILSAGTGDDEEGVYQSGTSMAAPLVGGIAALYLEAYPAAPPSDVMDAVLQSSVPDELRGLDSDTTNNLANVKTVVKTVTFDPDELVLAYAGDTPQPAAFNVSLAFAPLADVDVTLGLANVIFGSVEPSTIIFGPGNWSDPVTATFNPRQARFPIGGVLVVMAEAQEGNSPPVAHGLRILDNHIPRLGNALNRGFEIDEVPFQASAFSSQFSDEVRFRCPGDELEVWEAADILYEFTPATNATVEVDLCDSFFATKLIVAKGNSSTISDPLVCESGMNGCPPDDPTNKPSFQMEAGETYQIVVDGINGTAGMVMLRINEENGRRVAPLLPPPPPQLSPPPPPPPVDSEGPAARENDTNPDQESSGGILFRRHFFWISFR
ncbi:hypothetical protein BSKO_01659 [Bryopsis sp. KO-2023]|nr:hypothetical protein BSKO_01659 [Bryopsis sp. KO-2023]